MTGAAPRRGRLTVSILIAVLAAALGACGPGIGEAAKDRGGETPPQQTEEWFYDSFNEEQKMAYDAFRSMAEMQSLEVTSAEVRGELSSLYSRE